MMIRNLSLESYRGFESFKVADLKRVNLLVGTNNCGKSTVLEALDFLISKGDPSVLVRPLSRRGETKFGESEAFTVVSHLFHGNPRLRPGIKLQVSAENSFLPLTVEIVLREDLEQQATLFDLVDEDELPVFNDEAIPTLGLRISGEKGHELPDIPVWKDGSLAPRLSPRLRRARSEIGFRAGSSQFLTPDSLFPSSMHFMWDAAIASNRESEVVDAMRIFDRRIESVHFLTSRTSRAAPEGILLGFSDSGSRLPLGGFGDGMRRLLALSLALVKTSQGYLLIDEIDTGLHYSVMRDMWNLVVETALNSEIQVFATTHSYDCIAGLASLIEAQPELASEISIQHIDTSLTKAVNIEGQQIPLVVRNDIEVR